MIAENLISDTIVPLRTSDTGAEALSVMNDFFVRHLPIVNNEQLLGLLSEEEILDNDAEEAVGSYKLSTIHRFVHSHDHVYEVMRQFSEYNLTVIPVVDEKENYVGMICLEDLLHFFAETGSFREQGSIIVLEMLRRDYSLAEISRIVESEGALIYNTFVRTYPDSARIDVTLKVNRQDIMAILATLERFDYQIKGTFNEDQMYEGLKDRFDALMTYLNV